MKLFAIVTFRHSIQACVAAALTFSAPLTAQETAQPANKIPTLTLSYVVKALEEKAGNLVQERSAIVAEAKEAGKKTTELNRENVTVLDEISRCLSERNNRLRHQSTPSVPYYQAIQRQLLADTDLETLKVWWEHCRQGTPFESLADLKQLPLAAGLMAAKEDADKSVAEHKPAPVPPDPDHPELKPLDSSVSSRIKGDQSILDHIDGWKDQSVESKSKIISR